MDAPKPERAPRAGETIAGEVLDLAYGGMGVLRASGWVVMVPRAFPGDRVRVRLRRRRKGLFEGELLEIVEPSVDRVPPTCGHSEICGGCALQGLSPAAQLRWKEAQARSLLQRLGRLVPEVVAPAWQSPEVWYYRNKMEFSFARRPWVPAEELREGGPLPTGIALGLHLRGRYDAIFDIQDCRLQSPLTNRIVGELREIARRRGLPAYDSRSDEGLLRHLVVRRSLRHPDLLLVLVVRREDPAVPEIARELRAAVPEVSGIVASVNLRRATVARGDYDLPLLGEPFWRETLAGIDFRLGASSFFQTQTRGAEALAEEVREQTACGPGTRLLDLYCGAGTLSLPLARDGARVLGVEVLPAAVEEARATAAANGIQGAEFRCAAIEAKEAEPWETDRWDVVLVDPPRSGLHPRALEKLRGLRAPRIVYVSCNPSTLARDAGVLVNEDGYRARNLRVFDLFPQTPHLESVLTLTRDR
jgi:23S rRNA (uracil1939-C5)-methyltransferase